MGFVVPGAPEGSTGGLVFVVVFFMDYWPPVSSFHVI